ncbi:protein kinase [Actinocorallia sp. B10E7]|uniref:protein kinase domain-containing protein n=1 Tax=Actinocorallia sp. B10E7 TaxID=3153558 RepID=UPI00325E1D61
MTSGPQPGDEVGGYRLVEVVGAGGEGEVWLAVGPSGEKVALKLLSGLGEETRRRLLKEVALIRRVPPEYTARVLEADIDAMPPYLVREYLPGRTLSEVLEEDGELSGAVLTRVAIDTITALEAFHQAGIVHRDFKPANAIDGPDRVRVIDFGIARALDATVTQRDSPIGTPAFMSPEQVRCEQVGTASDVFSWASTMVYLATRTYPFGSGSLEAVYHRVQRGDPGLGSLREPLRSLLLDCLEKEPAKRPSAGQVRRRLEGFSREPRWSLRLRAGLLRRARTSAVAAGRAVRAAGTRLRPPARRFGGRLWQPPAAGFLTGFLAVGLVSGLVLWIKEERAGCPPPTELRVMVPSESLELFRELARGFEDEEEKEADDACRPVRVTVFPQPSLEAVRSGVGSGWADRLLTDPQPDVWVPMSRAEAEYVRSSSRSEDVFGEPPPEVRFAGDTGLKSTMVAVATSQAWEDLDVDRRSGAWRDWTGLLRRAEARDVTVLRPDPDTAASGTLGSVGFYTDSETVRSGMLKTFENQVADSSLTDAKAALCAAVELDRAVAIVPERVLAEYKAGSEAGEDCGGSGGPGRLSVLEVEGAHRLDYPFVRVVWPGAGKEDRDRYAGRFRLWVAGHPPEGDSWRPGSLPLEAGMVEATQRRFKEVRGGRAVELLFDRSGSMEWSVENGVPLLAAQNLARGILDELGEKDRVGLSVFPGQGEDTGVLLPPGAADETRSRVQDEVNGLEADRDSIPLYRAIKARVRAFDSRRLPGTLVVFTDGRESELGQDEGDEEADEVRAEFDEPGAPRVVVVVPAGGGCAGFLRTLDRLDDFACVEHGSLKSDGELRAELSREIWRD